MAIQLKLLVIIVFIVLSGTVGAQDNATRFNGNFPASQIRNLWQVCSFSFQQRQPQIPQPMRWDVCDCYVDVIRETLSPEEISKLDFEEAKKLTVKLINECNGKLDSKPPIITNARYYNRLFSA